MYEKYSKYKYELGPLGYWLFLSCILYIFGFSAYYASVYANLGSHVKEEDEMLNKLMIWNALKPALAILMLVWIIFSLFDGVGIFLLVVPCMVIFFGSFALTIKLLIDRYSTCNSVQTPHNICNDLLYCCIHYATVPSCAGLGPCPGSGVNTASDLKVNDDLEMFGIFAGIFFFMEFFLVLLAMGALLRLKRLKAAAILTNKMLIKFYETGTEEPNDDDNDDDDDGNAEEPEDEGIQSEIPGLTTGIEGNLNKESNGPFVESREQPRMLVQENRKKRIIKTGGPRSKQKTPNRFGSNQANIGSTVNGRNEGRIKRIPGDKNKCKEVRIPIGSNSRSRSKRERNGKRENDVNDRKDNNNNYEERECEKCGKETCLNVKHRLEQLKTLFFGGTRRIITKLCSIYYYCYYHLNTFTTYEMYHKKDDDVIYLSKKHRRKDQRDQKKQIK